MSAPQAVRLAGLLVALLLTGAGPAAAAQVVRAGELALNARDRAGGFCIAVDSHQACGRAPVRPYRALSADARRAVGGAVPVSVARVEVEFAGGRRVDVETVGPGRYAGRLAQRVRFFLLAEKGRVSLVRLYDASGALVGAAGGAEVRLGATEVLRQRGMVVRLVRERVFAPTPGALDRTEERSCIAVRSRGSAGGNCLQPGPRPPLSLAVADGCGRARSVVYGFADAAVRVRLGSGRLLTVSPRAGTVAFLVPRGEAVRWAEAAGVREHLSARPSGLPCVPNSGSAVMIYGAPRGAGVPQEGAREVAALDGHRLLVREAEDQRVCLGIDRLRECLLPPVDPDHLAVQRRAGLVAALLAPDVARVRLPDGREVEPVEGFLFARSGRGRLVFLDAAGARLAHARVGRQRPDGAPVTLLRGRGWRLRAQRFGRFWCAGLTDDCVAPGTGFASAYVHVRCDGRPPVLHGALPDGARTAAVRLVDGRLLPARAARVPGGNGRAYAVELPRRAAVRALRFGRSEVRLPLPAASRQCGYVLFEPALQP